jgi:FlaA1/EpsC-like NDP-sugar epimerase
MAAREIIAHTQSGLEVVGFLDDNKTLHNTSVEGRPVLGSVDDLPEAVRNLKVDEALIAVPSGSRELIRRVVARCRDAGVAFKIVPGLIEIIRGPVHLEQIREVHPEDLLGRETVEFDEAAILKEISGRRVLVTGAGGSIGGEICRQIARFSPAKLQLFGRGENQIYAIEEELRDAWPDVEIETIIGDIRDREGLAHVFDRYRPEFVYHAAAHKHVHYMEAHPEEAVKNNVFGTYNVIEVCRTSGVERVVMMSTDKAVNPGGVMGATKRTAEYLMMEAAQKHGLRAVSVRFGNVLGSRGSVVPLFMRQIRAGGPVTVSDPEASRFFMTKKEACMLVVQASIMGKGGEVFVLKMGSPIRILEMVKDLIALHGLRPDVDVPISFLGLRPGEKLHEDLVVEGEAVAPSNHEHILTAKPVLPSGWNGESVIEKLKGLTHAGDVEGIRSYLGRIIPDARIN